MSPTVTPIGMGPLGQQEFQALLQFSSLRQEVAR
mgnify:CR=1 FL=1